LEKKTSPEPTTVGLSVEVMGQGTRNSFPPSFFAAMVPGDLVAMEGMVGWLKTHRKLVSKK